MNERLFKIKQKYKKSKTTFTVNWAELSIATISNIELLFSVYF